jgi:hypothetical protein
MTHKSSQSDNRLSIVDHLINFHAIDDGCKCKKSAQSIIDDIEWDDICEEDDYYYRTAAREYPRFMVCRPELNHEKYTLCVLRTRTMTKCLTHFSCFRGRLPENLILEALEARMFEFKPSAESISHEIAITSDDVQTALRRSRARDKNQADQVRMFLRAYKQATLVMEVFNS